MKKVRSVLLALAMLVGAAAIAPPADAAVKLAPIPTNGPIATQYSWPLNEWYYVYHEGCTQKVRLGNFYGSGYVEMAYVSGTCGQSGANGYVYQPDQGSANPVHIPTSHQGYMCAVGNEAVSNCIQSGSGSLWIQRPVPNSIIHARAFVCGSGATCKLQHLTWMAQIPG